MVRKEDTVRLISAEGYEFVIEREAALVSNTLKNMLTSTGGWVGVVLYEIRTLPSFFIIPF
jgi:transcription elongation factor B subunit 1